MRYTLWWSTCSRIFLQSWSAALLEGAQARMWQESCIFSICLMASTRVTVLPEQTKNHHKIKSNTFLALWPVGGLTTLKRQRTGPVCTCSRRTKHQVRSRFGWASYNVLHCLILLLVSLQLPVKQPVNMKPKRQIFSERWTLTKKWSSQKSVNRYYIGH